MGAAFARMECCLLRSFCMQVINVGAVTTRESPPLDIATGVKRFIRQELAPDCSEADLGDDVSLLESGILDSFGIMTLLAFIEKTYRVSIPVEQLEPVNFESVSAISGLIDRMKRA